MTTPAQKPPVAPAPVAPPYQPSQEEQAYMQACGEAILRGLEGCTDAQATSNSAGFLAFANGVKALTQAYEEIRTGGKAPTGHQGS